MMQRVLDLLKEHNASYDLVDKILIIRKPIEVELFLYIKFLIKTKKLKVNNIIVKEKNHSW